jgi:hypothetical protein
MLELSRAAPYFRRIANAYGDAIGANWAFRCALPAKANGAFTILRFSNT